MQVIKAISQGMAFCFVTKVTELRLQAFASLQCSIERPKEVFLLSLKITLIKSPKENMIFFWSVLLFKKCVV
jgi:hypothetical protein